LIGFSTVREVFASELPLLQFATASDFDDATGLLVLSTSKGNLCTADFVADMAHKYLKHHLPPLLSVDISYDLNNPPVEKDTYLTSMRTARRSCKAEFL